ncbi:hypothetical protein DPMN_118553 [Dreissena polymorpha]|uniref:Uncharacterized protein n=1 Tax=Dreissena polymorpha TaxID=45954 RepID=A0A9D4JR69_DREPO|nr:hypothetical protein DPMN_118553 [Dreissena polymorpha]
MRTLLCNIHVHIALQGLPLLADHSTTGGTTCHTQIIVPIAVFLMKRCNWAYHT